MALMDSRFLSSHLFIFESLIAQSKLIANSPNRSHSLAQWCSFSHYCFSSHVQPDSLKLSSLIVDHTAESPRPLNGVRMPTHRIRLRGFRLAKSYHDLKYGISRTTPRISSISLYSAGRKCR